MQMCRPINTKLHFKYNNAFNLDLPFAKKSK